VEGEVGRSVAVDGESNVVIVGSHTTPFSFGGPELPSGGDTNGDCFVAKFSP
jgi:hypothetical protein